MAAVPSIGRASRVQPASAPEADLTRALYEKHANQIFRYCLHQLGSREEAEDAVQSTFLNAFRGIKGGVVPELESAWLFKIANNVCLSRRRSSWRRGRIESPADFDLVEELTPAPSRHADELIGLQDVLEQMPENQRRAILLREWQGLSYHEIAEELEVSQAAVETLIFRARRSLAQGLEQPAEKKRRLVRGADWANVLAGMKSLLLGSSVAVKVAATVAVVSATTVVASAPVQHHAPRSHHATPAAPTSSSSAPTTSTHTFTSSPVARSAQTGLALSPVRPLVVWPLTGGTKPAVDTSSDQPTSVVVVPPPPTPTSSPTPQTQDQSQPTVVTTPSTPPAAPVTPASEPAKSSSDAPGQVKKQDATPTPAAPVVQPTKNSDAPGQAKKQDSPSTVTTPAAAVTIPVTPSLPPGQAKKQDTPPTDSTPAATSSDQPPGQAKKQDSPSQNVVPVASPPSTVTLPAPVVTTPAPVATPPSLPPGQAKKQDTPPTVTTPDATVPQPNPALNSPIPGSTGAVPAAVQDASNAARNNGNGNGNGSGNGNSKGKGK